MAGRQIVHLLKILAKTALHSGSPFPGERFKLGRTTNEGMSDGVLMVTRVISDSGTEILNQMSAATVRVGESDDDSFRIELGNLRIAKDVDGVRTGERRVSDARSTVTIWRTW